MDGTMVESPNAELQRKDERRRFQATRLQRAHDRALRRLRKVSEDLASLRAVVERLIPQQGSDVAFEYAKWCARVGALSPAQRAARRARALSGLRA
jgi:hypothetical protein